MRINGIWHGVHALGQQVARPDQPPQQDVIAAIEIGVRVLQPGAEGVTDVFVRCRGGKAKLVEGVIAMQEFQAATRLAALDFLTHADKILHLVLARAI